ncbi:hypothetical protein ACETIH_06630 [Microvirga arabica]|uniref:HTH iclR-type domain-containing protein n=1 Tax=Microvirga arabica TaxID=1128671 RepID=A0ABV6Y5R9_9HYPH
MKIRHSHIEFEGSIAEWQEVKHLFPSNAQSTAASDAEAVTAAIPAPAADEADAEPMILDQVSDPSKLTEDAVDAFFDRRPVPKEQTDIIMAVFDAGDEGITTQEVASKTGMPPDTVKAYMMLLGKRKSYTPEWPKDLPIFKQQFEWKEQQNRYWMHPEMRAVIADGRAMLY